MKTLARERDRAGLLRRIERLQADTPARWGKMSAPQMICHLADAFRMALGESQVSQSSRLVDRTVFKLLALYAPGPWPQNIQTRPELDQQAGRGTCPGDFTMDVASVTALLQRMVDYDGRWLPHPILGRLSRRQWMRWGYRHMDHHLRQFGS